MSRLSTPQQPASPKHVEFSKNADTEIQCNSSSFQFDILNSGSYYDCEICIIRENLTASMSDYIFASVRLGTAANSKVTRIFIVPNNSSD